MPTYEYVCKKCGCIFSASGALEVFLTFKPTCPDCKSTEVRKKIFAPAVIFKGDGYYTTDHREKENPE